MTMTLASRLQSEAGARALKALYGENEETLKKQRARYLALQQKHEALFGAAETAFFSAPGRTEIGGNHTDHNHGCVLAAAVTLDMLACVSPTTDGVITLYSEGYERPFVVDTASLEMDPKEAGTTTALIRGVCFKLKELGLKVGGFNGVMTSDVLSGSGLSSSAAFEVLMACVLDGLWNGGKLDAVERAKLCQYVENNYFGKPSGLMDQSACSVGGLVGIDFADPKAPVFSSVQYDFAARGFSVVVVATRSSHDDLTQEYASIPAEMRSVAACFGKETLRDVDPAEFYAHLPCGKVSDRALLRAMHFFSESERVRGMVQALKEDRLPDFLARIVESGESSWKLLQNLYVGGSDSQSLALACALSEHILKGSGGWRVHGGGFAGTILAFVPGALLNEYVRTLNAVFGDGACTVLGIRACGPVRVEL